MWFLLIGLAMATAKLMDYGRFAAMPWWQVAIPFGLAVAWWAWADATGFTKRKAMEREQRKRQDRIDRQREQLGMGSSSKKR
jgi:small Trp-rich protein